MNNIFVIISNFELQTSKFSRGVVNLFGSVIFLSTCLSHLFNDNLNFLCKYFT